MTPSRPRPKAPARLEDPCVLTDRDFATIAHLVHRETGIVVGAAKRSMLIARLSHRLRHLGITDFAGYVRLLASEAGRAERDALVSSITTNVTRFFREPHHFAALAHMAPRLLQKARSGQRIRIWSAGCSTGEEAYSIAATLAEHAPDLLRHDLRILATDIDPKVVETARRGLYDRGLVGPETPAAFRRLMEPGDRPETFAIPPFLRQPIRFEVLNLHDPWPFQGKLDAVFCRNVVIYFDASTRNQLWHRFADRLTPGGALFIGHAERLDPDLGPFFVADGTTQYRRTYTPARQLTPAGAPSPFRSPACP